MSVHAYNVAGPDSLTLPHARSAVSKREASDFCYLRFAISISGRRRATNIDRLTVARYWNIPSSHVSDGEVIEPAAPVFLEPHDSWRL